MNLRSCILSILGRDDLKRVVDDLELPDVDRRSAEAMRAAVARSRRATTQELIGYLGKDGLKATCESMGVSAKGRREERIERLLGNGKANHSEQPSDRKRKMDNNGAAKEIAQGAPVANGNGKKLDVPALENWLWDAACVIRGTGRCAQVQGLHSSTGLLEAAVGRVRRRGSTSGPGIRQRGDGRKTGREGS
jgi:hypothetical protein